VYLYILAPFRRSNTIEKTRARLVRIRLKSVAPNAFTDVDFVRKPIGARVRNKIDGRNVPKVSYKKRSGRTNASIFSHRKCYARKNIDESMKSERFDSNRSKSSRICYVIGTERKTKLNRVNDGHCNDVTKLEITRGDRFPKR